MKNVIEYVQTHTNFTNEFTTVMSWHLTRTNLAIVESLITYLGIKETKYALKFDDVTEGPRLDKSAKFVKFSKRDAA